MTMLSPESDAAKVPAAIDSSSGRRVPSVRPGAIAAAFDFARQRVLVEHAETLVRGRGSSTAFGDDTRERRRVFL